jgi:hypothetical protein
MSKGHIYIKGYFYVILHEYKIYNPAILEFTNFSFLSFLFFFRILQFVTFAHQSMSG